MNIETTPILAHLAPDVFSGENNCRKVANHRGKAGGIKDLLDQVDLTSFPPKACNTKSGGYGRLYTYHEDLSAFMADITIEYEAKDGSKMFINYSYMAISKNVHYEVLQNVNGKQDAPKSHPHPANDHFGSEATAKRILTFAKGLVNKFRAMEGDDENKLAAYLQKLIKGVDKGFGGARKSLGAISQSVDLGINETYDRVMKGMDRLGKSVSSLQQAPQAKLSYDEQIMYTSASIEISIMA